MFNKFIFAGNTAHAIKFTIHIPQLQKNPTLNSTVIVFVENVLTNNPVHTGLFISPSGISKLDCPTTKKDTAERSVSIGRESLQVFLY